MRPVAFPSILLAAAAALGVAAPAQAATPDAGSPRLLAGFESLAELESSRPIDVDSVLSSEGVTEGKKALKLTVIEHREPPKSAEPGKGGEPTQGLRFTLVPAQSWVGMQEIDLDITNPETHQQHFQLTLVDTTHPAKNERRKAYLDVPGKTTVTLREPLSNAIGAVPQSGMTGWVVGNGVDIDLTHVKTIWLLLDRSATHDSLIVDNLRLVPTGATPVTATASSAAAAPPVIASPAPTPDAGHVKRPKMAVLDMQDLTGDMGPKVKLLTALLYDEVAATHSADAITSAEIGEILGVERQKQLLGCSESGCLAEIGGALGSDYLLTSQAGKIGSRVRLDIRLIDARKSRVVASAGDFVAAGSDDGLADTTIRLVRQVLHDSPLGAK